MTTVTTYSSSLNSLLAGMLARAPGAAHAVLATVDGVCVAVSAGLPAERAEQLATIGAGLLSIADGAGIMRNTGAPRHVIVEMYGGLILGRDDVFSGTLHQVFSRIPPEAAVYSPHRFSADLSNRVNMVMGDLGEDKRDFKQMLDERYDTTHVHPEQIDYIVCDFMNDQCGWRTVQGKDDGKAQQRAAAIQQLLKSGQWKVFWNQNNAVILIRAGESASP